MPRSIAHDAPNAPAHADFAAAWELTRRLSPRDQVRTMIRDAYGRLDSNSYPRLHRLGRTAPSTPWAIRLADSAGRYRLLCFDFDGKDSTGVVPELMEQAQDQAAVLSRTLNELAIAHVLCRSSGAGGRHVWLAVDGGADAAQVGALAAAAYACFRTLDHGMLRNPAEGAARPPLSPHRDGTSSRVLAGDVSALLAPSTSAADLDALTELLLERAPAPRAADSAPSGPVDVRHRAHRELSRAGAAHMATIDGGGNPSWTGFMCLLAAANAGWPLGDVEHAARTAPGMEHYRTKNTGRGGRRTRSASEARERLERQWAKAQQYAAVQRPLPTRREPQDLTELQAIVADVDAILTSFRVTPGRWGRSEADASRRSILTALTYLTLQTGKRTVAASIRDLALMAGLGRSTAQRALQTLTEAGFVARVTAADAGNAAEWRVTWRVSTGYGAVGSQPLDNPRPPAELFAHRAELVALLEHELTDQRHDLFTRAGLGHLAGRLYATLGQHVSLTVDSAARVLGVSIRHTGTILSRLRRHRLIKTRTDGWARAARDLRDAAARTLDVLGNLADRAHRYQAEREVWAWWNAELTTMHTTPRARPRRPTVSSRPLFAAPTAGERVWPRYPRSSTRADHRAARALVLDGALNPESRWQYLGEAA
ncbi:helix-turn-helix domain-containing protein [Clavibacter michiganensis subsp. phaseoli]|uniref:Helix-turn-helix domain-containing protein n=1 Tax=Clavibacter phaseoli TaxID=1734031 RepID=A0A8I0SDB5_9MICO|nr:helix-turn-helix domain-containing protein [Clavibacter phaseoli]MBF4632696.1 helix-turn-helix domain-containing protein [Clavibacter phaseoli]